LVNQKNINEKIIEDFLWPKAVHKILLENSQFFDMEGLKGRASSSSYTLKEGKKYDKIMSGLEALFEEYQQKGLVEFKYKTKIYFC